MGPIKKHHGNGRLAEIYNIDEKLKKDGLYRSYYENGNRFLEGYYIAGKKNGEWLTFYENNEPLFKENYVMDILEGKRTEYYENGEIRLVEDYKNGKWHGQRIYYYENGNMISVYNYENGELHGPQIKYFKNKNPMSILNFENSEQHGEQKYFYENGKLEVKEIYHFGEMVSCDEYKNPAAEGAIERKNSYLIKSFENAIKPDRLSLKNELRDVFKGQEYQELVSKGDIVAAHNLIKQIIK